MYGLSQIIYSLQCHHIEQNDLKSIENLIFKFIWNTDWSQRFPRDKIKRNTLKCNYPERGLKAPDIYTLNLALKYKMWLRYMSPNCVHPVAILNGIKLQEYGINNKHFQEIQYQPRGEFLDSVLHTTNLIWKSTERDFLILKRNPANAIHKNYTYMIAKHPLMNSKYIQTQHGNMALHLQKINITTFGQLHQEVVNNYIRLALLKTPNIDSFPQCGSTIYLKSNLMKLLLIAQLSFILNLTFGSQGNWQLWLILRIKYYNL